MSSVQREKRPQELLGLGWAGLRVSIGSLDVGRAVGLPQVLLCPMGSMERHMYPLLSPKSETVELSFSSPSSCGAETLVVSLLQVLTQT